MTSRPINPEPISWLCFVIPVIAANGAYLLSASAELVPWCFTYLEGCSSVSKAGREGWGHHLIKALMLPFASVLMLQWWLTWRWLEQLSPDKRMRRHLVFGLGMFGAAFMVLYATFLGVEGDTYQWLRRYGINLHFSGTVFAMILLTSMLHDDARLPAWIRKAMLGISAFFILVGIASLPLQFIVEDRKALLNILEWNYATVMFASFVVVGRGWRDTDFRLLDTRRT